MKKLKRELYNLLLNRKLVLWKAEYEKVQKNIEKYITNPINAFSMIKRTSYDIDYMHGRIARTIADFTKSIEHVKPSHEDLDGAVSGLLRLQKIYRLKTDDIVNGVIQGQTTGSKLSSRDIFTIVENAAANGRKGKTVGEYFNELKRRVHRKADAEEPDAITEQHIEDLEKMFRLAKGTFDTQEPETFVKNGKHTNVKESILYSQMCRKEILKSPKESKSLKCRYISNSPFSKIAPFKIEEADHSASLVLFHDVVYDSEIEVLKNMSKSRFRRGTIFSKTKDGEKTDDRVAKVAWLEDLQSDVVARISKRVEVI